MGTNLWKTILIPVDFSHFSAAALKAGLDLAVKVSSEVIVLHVAKDPSALPGYKENRKADQKITQRALDSAQDKFDKFLADAGVKKILKDSSLILRTEMVQGRPLQGILDCIKREQPSLVVIGSKGHTANQHLLVGSKAERVVQLSTAPVMIIKSRSGKKARSKK